LSIAKEEGVDRARRRVVVLLLTPLCAGAAKVASAYFFAELRELLPRFGSVVAMDMSELLVRGSGRRESGS